MLRHQYPLLSAAIAAALSLPMAAAWAGDITGRVTEAEHRTGAAERNGSRAAAESLRR